MFIPGKFRYCFYRPMGCVQNGLQHESTRLERKSWYNGFVFVPVIKRICVSKIKWLRRVTNIQRLCVTKIQRQSLTKIQRLCVMKIKRLYLTKIQRLIHMDARQDDIRRCRSHMTGVIGRHCVRSQ